MGEYVEILDLLIVSGVAVLSAVAGFLVSLGRAATKLNQEKAAESLGKAADAVSDAADKTEGFRRG